MLLLGRYCSLKNEILLACRLYRGAVGGSNGVSDRVLSLSGLHEALTDFRGSARDYLKGFDQVIIS